MHELALIRVAFEINLAFPVGDHFNFKYDVCLLEQSFLGLNFWLRRRWHWQNVRYSTLRRMPERAFFSYLAIECLLTWRCKMFKRASSESFKTILIEFAKLLVLRGLRLNYSRVLECAPLLGAVGTEFAIYRLS